LPGEPRTSLDVDAQQLGMHTFAKDIFYQRKVLLVEREEFSAGKGNQGQCRTGGGRDFRWDGSDGHGLFLSEF
jgi:hypothetical protein